MYVGNSSDELGKDALGSLHWDGPMAKQVIVELITYHKKSAVGLRDYYIRYHIRTGTVLQNQPDQILRHNDFVQSSNMRV